MKLFSAEQVREWDQYTIANEPIASIDLMERAANACVEWLETNNQTALPFHIFCGKGNNGGDGLAIARMLVMRELQVTVHILEFGHKGTTDFQTNLSRLHQQPTVEIRFIQTEENFPELSSRDTVIDALFGSGLNRGLEGVTAALVDHINKSGATIISIDVPSGLFCDRTSIGQPVIKADHTLSFQSYKLAMLLPENASLTGETHVLDIGLHQDYLQATSSNYQFTDIATARKLYRLRDRFSHKGSFGHALLVAGSYGKIGAALLAAEACLRSGVGLLSCHIPKCGYEILQAGLPEAMVMTDFNSSFNTRIEDDLSRYETIGIGPGIGKASETRMMIKDLLERYKRPMVIDADALNILAAHKEFWVSIPPYSILTPHPKEFARLFGETVSDFDRVDLALKNAKDLQVIIVLKGHHTLIATPDGEIFFNSTGNAGMATGGSGDVLTGILTGLLAQGYHPSEAAVFGVFLHGLAGDLATEYLSAEAMIAGDITKHLGSAFRQLITY